MTKRTLKVGYCYYNSGKPVSFIRLLGRWLMDEYQFNIGDRVTVSGEPGRLVIRKV